MEGLSKTPTPGYDVSDYGARQQVNRFIMERLYTGRLAVLRRENDALVKAGYDPNQFILVNRIGDTGVFFHVAVSAPVLINENGEVRDLDDARRRKKK